MVFANARTFFLHAAFSKFEVSDIKIAVMKKTIILIAITSTLIFISCKKSDITQHATLGIGECYSPLAGNFSVCVDSLFEQRCPEGAFCFWEGYARAVLTLKKNNVNTQFGLSTDDLWLTKDTTISGVKIVLNDVLPHPTIANCCSPTQAVLAVT